MIENKERMHQEKLLTKFREFLSPLMLINEFSKVSYTSNLNYETGNDFVPKKQWHFLDKPPIDIHNMSVNDPGFSLFAGD